MLYNILVCLQKDNTDYVYNIEIFFHNSVHSLKTAIAK